MVAIAIVGLGGMLNHNLTRVESFELAYRMQTSAPEALAQRDWALPSTALVAA